MSINALAINLGFISDLRAKLRGIIEDVDAGDFGKLLVTVGSVVQLLKPLLPLPFSLLSNEGVGRSLELQATAIEAQGFEFQSFVQFLTDALPYVQKLLNKDLTAIVPLIQAIVAYARSIQS